MSYNLTIQNDCGKLKTVAVYQTMPGVEGKSLVWFSKKIPANTKAEFTWDIKWGVTWGTTEDELVTGVMFTSGQTNPIDMDPNSTEADNYVTLSYKDGFQMINPRHDNGVSEGKMRVKADKSFDTNKAENLYVAVCVAGLPILAMEGNPNGTYTFHTHPVYYVAVTDAEQGVAVDGDYVSSPTEVVFATGVTGLAYSLTPGLDFKPIKK